MKTLTLTLAATLLFTLASPAQQAGVGYGSTKLAPGAPAPLLTDIEMLKGEAPGEWQPGHVYVLDFWATWCGPCIDSIPHMSSIQKRWADKNVHVIATAIWPRKGMTPTREFVTEYDELMQYSVAMDIGRRTGRDFMEAAGQYGIPYAMVVDGNGKIAWMGHPMDDLDGVLTEVVAGDFDRVAYEARKKERMAQADVLFKQFQEAVKVQDWAVIADVTDRMVALDPGMFAQFAFYHYVALERLGEREKAARYGRAAVESTLHDSTADLERIAWLIVDPRTEQTPEQRDLDLALMAATRADVLTRHKHPSILDTLARVHFLKGDLDEAVELQRRAVVAADEGALRTQLQGRMDEYLRARDAADS
jgi:thiol-disulfide isomerase/thioredoxin